VFFQFYHLFVLLHKAYSGSALLEHTVEVEVENICGPGYVYINNTCCKCA